MRDYCTVRPRPLTPEELAAKEQEEMENDPLTIINKLSTPYLGEEIPVIEMHSFGSAFDLAVEQFGSSSNTKFYWKGTVYTTEKR